VGILNHTYGAPDDTREATCVRLCDRIAYIDHDLDDAIRAGLLTEEDVPEKIRSGAGSRNSARINSFIRDLIMSSGNGALALSEPMQDLFDYFHSFMYAEIYTNPLAKGEEGKVDGILAALYDYYTAHPETLPEDYLGILENEGVERAACDYISGMTDGYAMEKYSELFIPFAWTVK
ncbi:MAG: deoxyguanosinetriphosphate triphosphohydrolase, partial [Clostridia bacterium]|nr:deoxyguanosinetriphosphate triphosphohydrolase [Clostridia bacterium]